MQVFIINLTQNDRLKRVTSDTLIVGVVSKTHFCRAFDWRGFELSRRVFKFSDIELGYLSWPEELMNRTKMKKVMVGCEPISYYWLTFEKWKVFGFLSSRWCMLKSEKFLSVDTRLRKVHG